MQRVKSKLLFLLKMKPAKTCLPPPCSIGQFVSMFTESCLAWQKAERKQRLAFRKNRLPPEPLPVIIKEWADYKGKSPQTLELVEALAFREWTCPSVMRLWLGKAVENRTTGCKPSWPA